MIVHIALFKWKDWVTDSNIEDALVEVRGLKNKISGVIDIHCGTNFSKWNEGFTHAVVVLAKDQEGLDSYRNHPDHQKVAQRIDEMEASGIGIDFEA